jgi:hypothetical protein
VCVKGAFFNRFLKGIKERVLGFDPCPRRGGGGCGGRCAALKPGFVTETILAIG